MSDNIEAGESSQAATPPQVQDQRPTQRSGYEGNPDLENSSNFPEHYQVKAKVYVKGVRGVDPKPYKIYKVLGDGQYKLSRDGKSDGKVYLQENLQTEP